MMRKLTKETELFPDPEDDVEERDEEVGLPAVVQGDGKNLAVVQEAVWKLAHKAPKLDDLSEDQIKRVVEMTLAQQLTEEMRHRVKLEGIDYEAEKAKWIARAGKADSPNTRRSYRNSIRKVEAWCAREKVNVLDLDTVQADEYIESLKASGCGTTTVNMAVTAVSAFFTWIERRHAGIKNPFRGTRSRPKNVRKKPLIVPLPEEVDKMIHAAKNPLRALIVLLVETGLRMDGAVAMTVSGDKLYTVTKGKDFEKKLPERAREEIKKAGLPIAHPFEGMTKAGLTGRFCYLTRTMEKRGRLRAAFSPHMLRHAFAVKLWKTMDPKDILVARDSLGHASVVTTERYLRSIKLDI